MKSKVEELVCVASDLPDVQGAPAVALIITPGGLGAPDFWEDYNKTLKVICSLFDSNKSDVNRCVAMHLLVQGPIQTGTVWNVRRRRSGDRIVDGVLECLK